MASLEKKKADEKGGRDKINSATSISKGPANEEVS
jgi:hypothetical protein